VWEKIKDKEESKFVSTLTKELVGHDKVYLFTATGRPSTQNYSCDKPRATKPPFPAKITALVKCKIRNILLFPFSKKFNFPFFIQITLEGNCASKLEKSTN